ncbi:MAG: hypothetical protein EBR82_22745 [Caulobacteraceae bacterium]|nr:hypothetical protein [Caulobacteraceae bacterium]
MTVTASMAARWIAPRMAGWENQTHTTNVLQWYMNNELCGVATEGEQIRGVACVRFLNNSEDGLEPYKHDPKGNVTWVELVVADQGVAISSLFDLLWSKYGRKPYVAYRRGLKNGKIRKFGVDMFDRMNSFCMKNLTLATN